MESIGSLHRSDGINVSEEMLNIMWRLTAVGTDVETSVLLYSALIGAYESKYPDLNCARVARSFLVMYFSKSLIGCGILSNTIFFF